MFFLKCKQYFKTPVLVLATFIYFAWVIKNILPGMKSQLADIEMEIVFPLIFVPISFIFFMFVSYAFFAKDNKNKVDEVIMTVGNGMLKNCLCGLCLLLILNFILISIFFFRLFPESMKAMGYLDRDVIWFTIRCYLIHVFLVNTFAILTGMAVSFVQSEIKAFSLMITIGCFFSQFFQSFLYKIAGNNSIVYHLMDLFGLTTRMYNAAPDHDYIYSVESVDLQRILFWIFVVITILLFIVLKGKKWFFVAGSGGVTILLFVLYMLPNGASYVDIDSRHDAWNEESTYYAAHIDQIGRLNCYLPEEEFKITKYVADINCGRVLKAEVEVHVDETELDTYVFALRHEYVLSGIEDEYGAKVEYSQEGDRVILTPDISKKHSMFVFRYQGASKILYSTSQAIRLPAYFAYLPFSGKRYLYLEFEQKDAERDTIWALYSGSALEGLGYETEYDITVHSNMKVYSNLEKVGNNHFRGVSDGATLAANAFLKEEQIGGATVIYSRAVNGYYPNQAANVRDMKEKWETFIAENHLQGKKIFVLGMVGPLHEDRYFGKDHLALTYPCTDQYQKYQKSGEIPYYEELTGDEMENIKNLLNEAEQ